MPPKRKSHPVVAESPAKRPTNQSQAGGSSGAEEEDQAWDRRAGMILEVTMRNFMCHEVRPDLSLLLLMANIAFL